MSSFDRITQMFGLRPVAEVARWPDAEEREHLARMFGWDGDEIVGSGALATHALRKAR